MSTIPIDTPLPGERVLALSPQDARAAALTWLRRPNLFPGRALTAPTLDGRQRWAAGRLAQRGQSYTAGVVRGLEVGYVIEPPADEGGTTRVRLHIAAGLALAVSGEDVVLAHAIESDLFGLPVVAPPDVFTTPEEGGGESGAGEPGALRARAIGPALAEVFATNPGALPRAGVLVLQPVTVDRAAIDPDDPCDRCGCGEAGDNVSFEDWRLADAVRLLWYAWPEEWRALPADTPRLRNALAYTVFDAEAALGPRDTLPWEEFGVPIALIAVDAEFRPRFADRATVVRQGGRARRSGLTLAVPASGPLSLAASARLPILWQARIEQLAEQIAERGDPAPDPETLAEDFGRLPPCGLLPTNVFNLASRSSLFFPAGFDLEAVPVPYEQLDLAIHETAALAPLDFSLGERVRILVPVSQASWEPRLLHREALDPEFVRTLERFRLARASALAARQGLRFKVARLTQGLTGKLPPVPSIEDDPAALERDELAPWGPEPPPPPADGGHRSTLLPGRHEHSFGSATATIAPAAGESLYTWVYLDPDHPPRELMLQWRSGGSFEHRAYWGENLIPFGNDGGPSRLRIGDLPQIGQWMRLEVPAAAVGLEEQAIDGIAFTLFDGRTAFGANGRLSGTTETLWFAGRLPAGAQRSGDWQFLSQEALWAPFEEDFGLRTETLLVPTDPLPTLVQLLVVSDLVEMQPQLAAALAPLSDAERGQLIAGGLVSARGLQGFIAYLRSRADRADDLVDYGFIKVQTDGYRLRQLVLGTTAATKLAVSPTLATIAKAETAVASQERISKFFGELKGGGAAGGGAGGGAAPGGAGGVLGGRLPPVSTFAVTPAASALGAAPSSGLIGFPGPRAGLELGGIGGGAGGGAVVLSPELLRAAPQLTLQLSTEIQPLGTIFTPGDITNAEPLVGKVSVRTTTIAERLAQPSATEARDYSTATRHEAVQGLLRLADELTAEDRDDVPGLEDRDYVPGLFAGIEMYGLDQDPFLETEEQRTRRRRPFADFIVQEDRNRLLDALLDPPDREDADEGSHFSDSADLSDRTVALMRQVEGRVRLYRDAIAACEQALGRVRTDLLGAQARERQIGEQLAEARHDVAVTRALIAEEEARISAINSRRAAVLANEVRFLAYLRPRDADNLLAPPLRNIDPGLIEAPVPACLRAHAELPDELTDMLRVVREAPAAWFRQGPRLLDGLDRVDLLVKTMQTAQLRSQLAVLRAPPATVAAIGLATTLAQVRGKQGQAVTLARAAATRIDLARFATLTWQGAREQAVQVVSLGDLIDGEHGRGEVARRAAELFDQLSRICGCLHAELSAVAPSIRLDWAERLSQFDEAPNLRNLASLPRWAEIDYVDRRQMQAYTDWLFNEIETREAAAVGLINDVVRMCLLLASHAPVGRIIAGRLPRPVTARPGLRIPLVALDPARLRIGMHALVYRANQIVARAVVEDVGSAEVSARVLTVVRDPVAGDSVDLDQTVQVQFAAATTVSFAKAPMRIV